MAALAEAYPDAKVALAFTNPLEMVVATVLSAQCTDAKVNEVTRGLFKRYRTARDYAEAPPGELEEAIHATGFFNFKAKLLRGMGRTLVDRFGGKVPRTMDELVELPGVARKTANIVLGNAFGVVEGIAVDTHVRRLAQRLGLSEEEDPGDIERDLMALLPRELWFEGTYLLIDHGRGVCNAKRPRCGECPVETMCPRIGVDVTVG
jgi:endonuclease-3